MGAMIVVRGVTGRALGVALAAWIGSGATAFAIDLGGGSSSSVTVGSRCFTDNVRVSGYVIARAEAYVVAGMDGFRIKDVLFQEGETVAADQEVIRLEAAMPMGGAPGAAPGAAGGAPVGGGASSPMTSLHAPAAGVVSKVAAQVGQMTRSSGDPLMHITTDPDLDLIVDVPSLYVTRVRVGAVTHVLRNDGEVVVASVRIPATDVDAATQFGRARIGIPPRSGLRAGSFARATIETERRCGLSVPREAIVRQNNATSVLVTRDGSVQDRRVVVGLSSSDAVEIQSGLQEGDSVVVNGTGVY